MENKCITIKKLYINYSLNNKLRNIRRFFQNCLSERYSLVQSYKTNKSTHGKIIDKKNKAYFFKILPLRESKSELKNYKKLQILYPLPKLNRYIELNDSGILLYDYEDIVEKEGGLLIDYLNEDKFDIRILRRILKIYKNSFKFHHALKDKYTSDKFFSRRVKPRLKEGILQDRRISEILDYQIKINGKIFTQNTREIIEETIDYFNKPRRELCFLSQGDPEPINLSTQPLFFDFETAGLNPVISEFAIFLWGFFMEEAYYAPKYNKNYYLSRKGFLEGLGKNKPIILVDKDIKNKTLNITFEYFISRSRKKIILCYFRDFFKKIADKEEIILLKKFRYFLVMRILTTLDPKKYSLEDIYSTLAFLHLFCNSRITKTLNMRKNILDMIKN